ncbi:MAG: DUF4974 domain-containing protein [Bacteroidaceae bacterium]|nr:DUF4974 domain-containing protein [Bacteroidaceae bacterium]
MKQVEDKRTFLRMQEHPEEYSDQALEAMITDLDSCPDTEAAWRRFAQRHPRQTRRSRLLARFMALSKLRRIAAIILVAIFLSGLNYAAFSIFRILLPRGGKEPSEVATVRQRRPQSDDTIPPDTLFRFDNVQLDSILTMVGRHYGREVVFRDTAARSLRLYTSWHSAQPIEDFVELLREFDAFRLTDEHDTLFVESTKPREQRR